MGRYTPWSTVRVEILAMLLSVYPEGLSLAEVAWRLRSTAVGQAAASPAAPETSIGGPDTYKTTTRPGEAAVRQALSWMARMGLLERLARGVYRVSPEALEHVETIVRAWPSIAEKYNIISGKLKVNGDGLKVNSVVNCYREIKSVTNEKEKEIIENVKRIVKEKYGERLESVDLAVVEEMARMAVRGRPYLESAGRPLAEVLRDRAPPSSSINNYSVGEIGESLRYLTELGVLFKWGRKLRLDRGLLVEAAWEAARRGGPAW